MVIGREAALTCPVNQTDSGGRSRVRAVRGCAPSAYVAAAWKRCRVEWWEGTKMPDWTRRNFGDLRDVSPQNVRVQWRFAREALGSPELGVSRFTYDRGARMPWGHRHRVQEEVYVVVAGSGRVTFCWT